MIFNLKKEEDNEWLKLDNPLHFWPLYVINYKKLSTVIVQRINNNFKFLVAAYEALACSAAFPKLGRNKELALHILMENKGNLQAAVMDLLRCDTLDWEQYPIIYNYLYNDVDNWTPEEIAGFQDAIYKSEKDFHQVANEVSYFLLWMILIDLIMKWIKHIWW